MYLVGFSMVLNLYILVSLVIPSVLIILGSIGISTFYFIKRFNKSDFVQREIQTNRDFKYIQSELLGKFSKSIFGRDRNELTVSHREYSRQDLELNAISNKTNSAFLTNSFCFDKKQNYHFNSLISAIDQTGHDTYRRYQANENFHFALPKKFVLMGNYGFNRNERMQQTINQHNAGLAFGKNFYESLYAGITYDYNNTSHSSYQEVTHKPGFDLNYHKKLPTNGLLTLTYRYQMQISDHQSNDIFINSINEEYTLVDGQLILLNKPFVNQTSVVVTDITGTVIYQPNFDYILVQQGNFTEIKRVPGGLISNNSPVFVDYIALQPGNYKYNTNYHNFTASVSLFNRLIEVYYRYSKQNFVNLSQTDYLTLNYFNQNVVGLRLEYKFANAGAEYDYYNSTVIPYKSYRCFVGLQGDIKQNFSYSLIGNMRNTVMLTENLTQKYRDVTASLAYVIKTKNKIKLDVGYMNQVGQGINLDLITAKTEYTTFYRRLYFTLGLEFYKRTYQGEKIDFKGGYVQLSRKF